MCLYINNDRDKRDWTAWTKYFQIIFNVDVFNAGIYLIRVADHKERWSCVVMVK
jgi:hypothetical protein